MIPCIFIPFLNRKDLLQRSISSIDFPVEKLMICNNGPETLHDLQIPETVKVRDEKVGQKWGVASSWNFGVHMAFNEWGMDSLIACGNDIQWASGDLEKFHLAHQENPDAEWLFGAHSFSTWMMTRKGFESFGWFDEGYEKAYLEDSDAWRRIGLMKSKVISVDTKAIHGEAPFWGSSTINSDENLKRTVQAAHGRNWQYHIAKWGGRIEGNTERFTTPFNRGGGINEWSLDEAARKRPYFRTNS